MKQITVIGSANADLVIHTERIPHPGETVHGHSFAVNAGGKGLNQAVAVARLGGEVTFVGAVGCDDNGAMLIRTLEQNHVTFEGIRCEDAPTGTALITVVGGDNCIVLDAGANGCVTPSFVRARYEKAAQGAWVVMQLEIPLDTVEEVCRQAAQNGQKVLLNPAPFRELPASLYAEIDCLVPNEWEAAQLTGIATDRLEGCEQALRELMRRGVRQVVITLGERGCIYNDGEEIVHTPACPTTVVDTTSAGDCFIGALVLRLSQGNSIREAVAFANAAASIAVSRAGAACSIPSMQELQEVGFA